MPPRPLLRRFRPSFLVASGLRIGLTALLLLAPFLPDGRADIQQPPGRPRSPGERRLQRQNGPAVALPQDTVVDQGGRVEIILRGEGQSGRMLDFLLRSQPSHGTLSAAPVQVSRNAATIVYFHNPGDDANDDEFTFAVQASGSAVSAPQTVRVRILAAEPSLEVSPPELDFGAVKAGETARADLTLSNHGGSEASGRVSPPPPWTVEGSAEYRLPRGGSETFRLVFKPTGEEVFRDELHFRYEARGGVRLVGTGLADPAQQAALAARIAPASAGVPTGINVDGVIPGLRPEGNARPAGNLAVAPSGGAAPAVPAGTVGSPAGKLQTPVAGVGGSRTPDTPIPAASGTLAVTDTRGEAAGNPSVANPDDTSVILNEASVEELQLQYAGTTTADLAWMPPVPKPASYRVELRYLSLDGEKLRIDWRPYASVKFNVGRDKVTAHLIGLPPGGLQMMRVVAVDTAGRLAAPSPMITAPMQTASRWTRYVTPINVLVALLLICGTLVIRRRLEERAMLREIDESRARRREAEAGLAR